MLLKKCLGHNIKSDTDASLMPGGALRVRYRFKANIDLHNSSFWGVKVDRNRNFRTRAFISTSANRGTFPKSINMRYY